MEQQTFDLYFGESIDGGAFKQYDINKMTDSQLVEIIRTGLAHPEYKDSGVWDDAKTEEDAIRLLMPGFKAHLKKLKKMPDPIILYRYTDRIGRGGHGVCWSSKKLSRDELVAGNLDYLVRAKLSLIAKTPKSNIDIAVTLWENDRTPAAHEIRIYDPSKIRDIDNGDVY